MSKRITIDEFIERSKRVHGDKYDYSKVEYKNNHTKVCIICPKHGEFWQRPADHLRGCGCQKCVGLSKLQNEEFIEKAKRIHGNKYDYSKVNYINNHTKVCIICPEHGEFWQTPHTHLNGNGCSKCANLIKGNYKKSYTDEFIGKAREIHGDKYDYSKVEYKNNYTKVCIICPEHGEFWQTPLNHLQKHGCSECVGNQKNNTNKFIGKAREIHGDKYDYSKVEYKNATTKIEIICPEHGEFWQRPYAHLNGEGCPSCGISKISKSLSSSLDSFIKKAKEIHGDKYDYTMTEYTNNRVKSLIKCQLHGEFRQSPHDHLSGRGCPKCNQSHLEQKIENFLKSNNIIYISQASFEWMGKQKLDFFLPQYNIGIECQGIQHFEPVSIFGGDKELEKNKINDELKKKKCQENGINLLYFSDIKYNFPYDVITDVSVLLEKIQTMNVIHQ